MASTSEFYDSCSRDNKTSIDDDIFKYHVINAWKDHVHDHADKCQQSKIGILNTPTTKYETSGPDLIDIDSELKSITRRLTKCPDKKYQHPCQNHSNEENKFMNFEFDHENNTENIAKFKNQKCKPKRQYQINTDSCTPNNPREISLVPNKLSDCSKKNDYKDWITRESKCNKSTTPFSYDSSNNKMDEFMGIAPFPAERGLRSESENLSTRNVMNHQNHWGGKSKPNPWRIGSQDDHIYAVTNMGNSRSSQ